MLHLFLQQLKKFFSPSTFFFFEKTFPGELLYLVSLMEGNNRWSPRFAKLGF